MYLELNCFGLAVLLTIFMNSRRHVNRYLFDQKLFFALLLTTALILVFDMFMWLFDGMPGPLIHPAYQWITVCYYALNPLICALWYLYADYYINRSEAHLKKISIPVLIPVCVNLCLSIMSVYWHGMFYIDGNNVYHRGPLFFVMALICFLFLAYTMVYIFLNRRKIQRREYKTLLLFPIPPIIGGVIQTLFYGVSLIWVCATISLLIIFIDFQNDQLSTDHLTGLYNRRQLDNYLRTKSQNAGGKTVAGLMIDLDSFKVINDTYGHDSGDRALKYVAEILKETFRKNDFVARYGGDEFLAIVEINQRSDLEKAVSRLNENLEQFNAKKLIPYEIKLSIGYDNLSKGKDVRDFLKHIDDLMYTNKQKTGGQIQEQ